MLDEPRTFDDGEPDERALDLCDDDQVAAWAQRYDVDPEVIREACAQVGPNRTAVELLLAAPPR